MAFASPAESQLTSSIRNCGKIGIELGVAPRIGIAEGLARTVEWYLAGESWWRPLQNGAWRDWMQRHYGTAV